MYFFRSEDFDDNQLLHYLERYAQVVTEGGRAGFFSLDMDGEEEEEFQVEVVEGGVEVDDDDVTNVLVPKLTDSSNDNIARLRTEGYGVDDDNELPPENIPTTPK